MYTSSTYYYEGWRDPKTALRELHRMERGITAVDIETPSTTDRRPIGIGFTLNSDEGFYFPWGSADTPWHLLQNPNILKIFHNGNFDLGILGNYGVPTSPYHDSMILAHLCGYEQLSLAALSWHLFQKVLTSIPDLIGYDKKNQLLMTQVEPEKVAAKCIQDVIYTHAVYDSLVSKVDSLLYKLEMDYMPILVRMSRVGIKVNTIRLQEHDDRITKDLAYYRMICDGLGFNPGSSKQFAAVLESRGWRVKKHPKTWNPKLDKEELTTRYQRDPLAHLVLKYRELAKLKGTYIKAIWNKHLRNGRVFPTYHQTVTESGRISSSNPNGQNIPPIMRDIFIPSDGNIFENHDLSQIELRVLAFMCKEFCGDPTMQDVYDNDGDIHDATARFVTELGLNVDRQTGKHGNFASVYMGNEHTLYVKVGIPLHIGRQFIALFHQTYPGVGELIRQTTNFLLENGYVTTLNGRRREFPDLAYHLQNRNEKMVNASIREAFNHRIQGTAGEDLKRWQARAPIPLMVNTVHDQGIYDVHPSYEFDHRTSEQLSWYRTPMDVGRGMSWADSGKKENKVLNPDHPKGIWG